MNIRTCITGIQYSDSSRKRKVWCIFSSLLQSKSNNSQSAYKIYSGTLMMYHSQAIFTAELDKTVHTSKVFNISVCIISEILAPHCHKKILKHVS